MFGDQYDSREERLLLAVFVTGMEVEINRAEEMGSLFRFVVLCSFIVLVELQLT